MEYEDLDQNKKDAVLSASMNLMQVITEVWGTDRGIELWDSIATTLGPDVKGALFFAMISGEGLGDVVLSRVNTNQAIPIIKTIRSATGFGLKEAKDIYYAARDRGVVKFAVNPKNRMGLLRDLRGVGCTVR